MYKTCFHFSPPAKNNFDGPILPSWTICKKCPKIYSAFRKQVRDFTIHRRFYYIHFGSTFHCTANLTYSNNTCISFFIYFSRNVLNTRQCDRILVTRRDVTKLWFRKLNRDGFKQSEQVFCLRTNNNLLKKKNADNVKYILHGILSPAFF